MRQNAFSLNWLRWKNPRLGYIHSRPNYTTDIEYDHKSHCPTTANHKSYGKESADSEWRVSRPRKFGATSTCTCRIILNRAMDIFPTLYGPSPIVYLRYTRTAAWIHLRPSALVALQTNQLRKVCFLAAENSALALMDYATAIHDKTTIRQFESNFDALLDQQYRKTSILN